MDKTQKTIESYNKCAESFQSRFMDLNLYRASFDKFISFLSDNAEILDVGCGPGNCTRYMLGSNTTYSITGIDLSGSMIDLAKQNVIGAMFVLSDIRTHDYTRNTYDAIIAAFCLPFLYDYEASKLITDMSFGLKEGGILYLSTMEGEGNRWETTSFSGANEIFFNYYKSEFLKAQFEANNLEIMEEIIQNYEIAGCQPLVDLIFILKKRNRQ